MLGGGIEPPTFVAVKGFRGGLWTSWSRGLRGDFIDLAGQACRPSELVALVAGGGELFGVLSFWVGGVEGSEVGIFVVINVLLTGPPSYYSDFCGVLDGELLMQSGNMYSGEIFSIVNTVFKVR